MTDSTNATVTFTYECPYRNICTDNGVKCNSCIHSPRRSYYEPYIPYYPWYPTPYPWSPTVTYTTSSTSYYTENNAKATG